MYKKRYDYHLHAVVTGFVLIVLISIPGNSLFATEHLMTMGRRHTYLCYQTGTWMQHSLGNKFQLLYSVTPSCCVNRYITLND